MQKNRFRGFTLIELLVVIAIIGILSAVVLASLNTARNKGTDAAIQSDLSTIQTEAEIYYGGTGANSYGTLGTGTVGVDTTCTAGTAGSLIADLSIKNALAGAYNANASVAAPRIACVANGTSYAFGAKLVAPTAASWWCIDSTGKAESVLVTAQAFPASGGAAFTCP